MEFSGTVESAGKAVTSFKPGDEVFGGTLFQLGCQAEYVCVAEDGMIAPKPVNMALEEAAAVFFGGITVLGFLGKAPIQKGQKVLVYGASAAVSACSRCNWRSILARKSPRFAARQTWHW